MEPVIAIACSIFKNELEYLKSTGKISLPIVYVNSMLHMEPANLQAVLDQKIAEMPQGKVILIFGDCHARMIDYEQHSNVVRTPGINCCEIFLGTERYKKIRSEGGFILLPEWAERWREVFIGYMGFKDSKGLSLFMNDMHKKLVYVDTGFETINRDLLDEISAFAGLPLEICSCRIDGLEQSLIQLINEQTSQSH